MRRNNRVILILTICISIILSCACGRYPGAEVDTKAETRENGTQTETETDTTVENAEGEIAEAETTGAEMETTVESSEPIKLAEFTATKQELNYPFSGVYEMAGNSQTVYMWGSPDGLPEKNGGASLLRIGKDGEKIIWTMNWEFGPSEGLVASTYLTAHEYAMGLETDAAGNGYVLVGHGEPYDESGSWSDTRYFLRKYGEEGELCWETELINELNWESLYPSELVEINGTLYVGYSDSSQIMAYDGERGELIKVYEDPYPYSNGTGHHVGIRGMYGIMSMYEMSDGNLGLIYFNGPQRDGVHEAMAVLNLETGKLENETPTRLAGEVGVSVFGYHDLSGVDTGYDVLWWDETRVMGGIHEEQEVTELFTFADLGITNKIECVANLGDGKLAAVDETGTLWWIVGE